MPDNAAETLVVLKRIATALEAIAEQIAQINDCTEETEAGKSLSVSVKNEVRTRAS